MRKVTLVTPLVSMSANVARKLELYNSALTLMTYLRND